MDLQLDLSRICANAYTRMDNLQARVGQDKWALDGILYPWGLQNTRYNGLKVEDDVCMRRSEKIRIRNFQCLLDRIHDCS